MLPSATIGSKFLLSINQRKWCQLLYDLLRDPAESTDVSGTYPEDFILRS